jgi:hypothetical protein
MAAAGNGNGNGNRQPWMPEGNLPPPPPDMRPTSQIKTWIFEAAHDLFTSENNTNLLKDILTELLHKAENDELLKEAIGLKQRINYQHIEIKNAASAYFRRRIFASKQKNLNHLRSTIRAGRRKHKSRRNKKQRKYRQTRKY